MELTYAARHCHFDPTQYVQPKGAIDMKRYLQNHRYSSQFRTIHNRYAPILSSNIELKSPCSGLIDISLENRESKGVARIRMSIYATITRCIHTSRMTLVIESPSLDGQVASSWKAHGAEIIHLDRPGTSRDTCAAEDTDLVANGSINIEKSVGRSSGLHSVACHALSIVLVHLPFAVGVISRAALQQKTSEVIVEVGAAEPVAAKTDGVVALQTRDPPCCS